MPDQLTDRARKAAEEITKSLEDGLDLEVTLDGREMAVNSSSFITTDGFINDIAAIIERHMREEWKYEGIPTGERVLVAVEYHDGAPSRVGIGEVYVEDGKKEILVDDGIERFDVDLPLTVYAWRELSAPPPNVGKEAAPCPEK